MFPVSSEKRITPLPNDEARALLREYYHVGDEVDIDLLRKGVVVGFGTKYVPRGGLNHKMAGVYIDFEVLRVVPKLASLPERLIRREVLESPPCDCEDPTLWTTHKDRERYANIFIRIGDLADTPFWEGDTVIFTHDQNRGCGEVAHWRIKEIAELKNESGDRPCWLNSTKDWRTAVAPLTSLTLVSHGNLWKMEHGEPMEFASIDEEARFYQSLGMSQKVCRNTQTGGEKKEWCEYDFADAVSLIRSGRGHEMKVKNSKLMTFVVIKYDRTEFGLRMRTHTLAKFGLSDEGISDDRP